MEAGAIEETIQVRKLHFKGKGIVMKIGSKEDV